MAEHPITPPRELVQQWLKGYPGETALSVATQAARWGADQELEACVKWIEDCGYHPSVPKNLRAARRPKPLSLKEQALAALARLKSGALCADCVTDESTIRRALAQLPDE